MASLTFPDNETSAREDEKHKQVMIKTETTHAVNSLFIAVPPFELPPTMILLYYFTLICEGSTSYILLSWERQWQDTMNYLYRPEIQVAYLKIEIL